MDPGKTWYWGDGMELEQEFSAEGVEGPGSFSTKVSSCADPTSILYHNPCSR